MNEENVNNFSCCEIVLFTSVNTFYMLTQYTESQSLHKNIFLSNKINKSRQMCKMITVFFL